MIPIATERRWSAQRTLPVRALLGSAVRTVPGMVGVMSKAFGPELLITLMGRAALPQT